jgi:hypothetical protein
MYLATRTVNLGAFGVHVDKSDCDSWITARHSLSHLAVSSFTDWQKRQTAAWHSSSSSGGDRQPNKFCSSKFRESYLISWKAAQTEVCRVSPLGMKHWCTWIILGRPCGSVPTLRCLSEFDDDIAPEGAVSEILMSIDRDMFMRAFAEWKHRLQQHIDKGGDYL